MEFLKALANNQEYWNMQIAQAAVSVQNYETWYVIQSVIVLVYVAAWTLYFTRGEKWSWDFKENVFMTLILVGMAVVFSTLMALGSIADYNMAKTNPQLWALKQIVKYLP
jgi:hypothetical protein